MIEKFIEIKNVGRFRDYDAAGEVALRRTNLIYAENGRGKTTMCDILRSMRTGDPGLVEGRRTLGSGNSQLIRVRLAGSTLVFRDGAWSSNLPELEVFDGRYVHENVYAGEFVGVGQRRQLYGVILGAKGVALQRRIERIDEQSRAAAKALRIAKSELQTHVPTGMALSKFVALDKIDGVGKQIEAKQAEVRALKLRSEVASQPALAEVVLPELPEGFTELLARKIGGGDGGGDLLMRDHLTHSTTGATTEWVEQGVGFQKAQVCPFCGQDTADQALVAAYRALFGEQLKRLLADVRHTKAAVDGLGDGAPGRRAEKVVADNDTRRAFWSQFTPISLPSLSAEGWEGPYSQLVSEALALIRAKSASPMDVIEVSSELSAAVDRMKGLLPPIQSYNEAVSLANSRVEQIKETTTAGDLVASEAELSMLLAASARHDKEGAAAVLEYKKAEAAKAAFDVQRETARQELDAHSASALPKFQDTVNDVLLEFGASFRLSDLKSRFPGGQASAGYQLEINKVAVGLGGADTPDSEPSFRNTLSGGDRTTLALAIFLAQLDLAADISDRVVVFDDPFGSQDTSRRTCTVQRILAVASRVAQLIVLSHEAGFLSLIAKEAHGALKLKTLHMPRVGTTDTIVANWDIESSVQSGHEEDYRRIQKFLNQGDGEPRAVARSIRPLLEGHLRMMFVGHFPDTEWLGGFIDKIRSAEPGDPLRPMQGVVAEIEKINGFSKRYHHRTNPNAEREPINDAELSNYAKRTLALVSAPPNLSNR